MESARPRYARLGRQDLANLLIEAPDTPMHMAVVLVLDRAPILDAAGELDVDRLRRRIAGRLGELPELRQVLRGGLRPGQAVWVDAPAIRISEQVRVAPVPRPGGERELLRVVETLVARPLDRTRPLWEAWFLTGLTGRRVAVLLKIHHAVTDGVGMVRIVGALLDPAPGADRAAVRWTEAASPPAWRLELEGWRLGVRDLARLARAAAHPARAARAGALVATTIISATAAAGRPRATALNSPIHPGRRLAVSRLRLDDVVRVAHEEGATVNDVVLEIVAGGLASALRARGEPVKGSANALVARSPRRREPGSRNLAGSVIVALPLDAAGGRARLREIARRTRRAKARQSYALLEALQVLVVLTRLGRALSRRQNAVQLGVSDLVGPSRPLYLGAARIEDAIPITPISGSVTIDFCALSYAGRLNISAIADATAWPDLAPVVEGMDAGWARLAAEPLSRRARSRARLRPA